MICKKIAKKLKFGKIYYNFLKDMIVLDDGKKATFLTYTKGHTKENKYFKEINSYKVEMTDELKILINDIAISDLGYLEIKFL